jgi:hypothetical protein
MPHRGEAALQTPASVEGMVSSAWAKSENGSAFRKNAATARCPQVRAPRGSRSRRTAIATASTAVPDSRRPRVTWNGAYPSVPTLIRRKLKPQMRESTPNRIRQSSAGRAAGVGAGAEGLAGGAVCGVVAVLMGSTMARATT